MEHTSNSLIQKVLSTNSASQDKTRNLYKLQNVPGNNKIFDK